MSRSTSVVSFCLLLAGILFVAAPVIAQDTPAPPPCSAPECRQFDFWVGEWDLTWDGGSGTNRIESILGGCVIQENFSGNMANDTVFNGMSHSVYSPSKGAWLQTWVDNKGGYLDFEGGMEDGKMILSRQGERDGQQFLSRMVFRNIEEDSIDWGWERSTDDGETWTTLWAIHYERQK